MTGPQLMPGAVVPPLRRDFPLSRMVAYAGATWDWHRLHYDTAYVKERGLPAPVVDGQVLGALLAEQLQRWLGPQCVLRTLRFRFAQPVFAGESVVCTGRVTAVGDDGLVTVEQRVEVSGPRARTAVATAGATLTLSPPPAPPVAGGPA